MNENTAAMTFRLPPKLKQTFDEQCRQNDQMASQVIRQLIREWLKSQEKSK